MRPSDDYTANWWVFHEFSSFIYANDLLLFWSSKFAGRPAQGAIIDSDGRGTGGLCLWPESGEHSPSWFACAQPVRSTRGPTERKPITWRTELFTCFFLVCALCGCGSVFVVIPMHTCHCVLFRAFMTNKAMTQGGVLEINARCSSYFLLIRLEKVYANGEFEERQWRNSRAHRRPLFMWCHIHIHTNTHNRFCVMRLMYANPVNWIRSAFGGGNFYVFPFLRALTTNYTRKMVEDLLVWNCCEFKHELVRIGSLSAFSFRWQMGLRLWF